jgi:integration host factor subunit alpha
MFDNNEELNVAALGKADLAEALVVKHGVSKNVAKVFVDKFFEIIRKALESGENVRLSGFGNFILRDKGARPGRNPKTGEPVTITERRVVTFRSGLKLRTHISKKN